MHRFYFSSPLVPNVSIELEKEEMHHLKNVLRIERGEKIEIINGKGELAVALYDTSIKTLSVQTFPKPKNRSVLFQAMCEKSHLKMIFQKGTELGVTQFYLFSCQKSKQTCMSPAFLKQLKKVTISAIKQCRSLFLPSIQIGSMKDLEKVPLSLYLADFNGNPFEPVSTSNGFIVGPESGFTKQEVDFLKKTCKAKPTTLSKNILRVETAAIVSCFLMSF